MSKYHELKKDIRVGFKKNKVKKTVDGEVSQLRREIRAEILKKLALEEDRRNRSKLFLFSQKIRFGRSLRFGC